LEHRLSDEKCAREPEFAFTCKPISLRVAPASPPMTGLDAGFGTGVDAGLLLRRPTPLAASLVASLRSGGRFWRPPAATGMAT
jgi:hypothetical protein